MKRSPIDWSTVRLPPHRFWILGRRWRLRWGDPERDTLTKDLVGACVHAERAIYLTVPLRLKKNRKLAWEVFAHELLHAMTGRRSDGLGGVSERTILKLEVPLAQVLIENGAMFWR